MKQTRRHELKTNDLSIWLQNAGHTLSQYWKYVAGGVGAVVLILLIGMLVHRSNEAERREAWNAYYEVRGKTEVNADLLAQADKLVEDYGNEAAIGPAVWELKADLAYRLAMSLNPFTERENRAKYLEESQKAYQHLLDRYGRDTGVAVRAHMGLAAIEENLVLAGRGNADNVRKHYQAVVDAGTSPFQSEAQRRLTGLNTRLQKLDVVATRPAAPPETAPVTNAAAPATQAAPDATTPPAATATAPAGG